jgi:amino acid transporter
MLLAVSRLMFAWAEDGVFPKAVATVHHRWHTPHLAIFLSGAMATMGILGSHLSGDFFIGVDILVTSMLVNFLLMCFTVFTLPHRNKTLAGEVKVFPSRHVQIPLAFAGVLTLFLFLVVHIWKDLSSQVEAWYFHSTYIWIIVLAVASLIYFRELSSLGRKGVDVKELFSTLPPE